MTASSLSLFSLPTAYSVSSFSFKQHSPFFRLVCLCVFYVQYQNMQTADRWLEAIRGTKRLGASRATSIFFGSFSSLFSSSLSLPKCFKLVHTRLHPSLGPDFKSERVFNATPCLMIAHTHTVCDVFIKDGQECVSPNLISCA